MIGRVLLNKVGTKPGEFPKILKNCESMAFDTAMQQLEEAFGEYGSLALALLSAALDKVSEPHNIDSFIRAQKYIKPIYDDILKIVSSALKRQDYKALKLALSKIKKKYGTEMFGVVKETVSHFGIKRLNPNLIKKLNSIDVDKIVSNAVHGAIYNFFNIDSSIESEIKPTILKACFEQR